MLVATLEKSIGFEKLPYEVEMAIRNKFRILADMLYDEVMANVSGRVLQTKSGQLAKSIEKVIDADSNPMYAIIGPEPETTKAWVLEFGGQGYYPILPVTARALYFFWERIGQYVALHYVNHPPSEAYQYLGLAEEIVEAIAEDEMAEAVTMAWGER